MELFKKNKILVLILSLSFLLSLFYSFHFKIRPQVDADAYDWIGLNIAQGNGYRSAINSDLRHDGSITRVGPLYEYFLAGIYKVFGHSYSWVWFFQAILHALAAWLIYLTCLLVFSGFERKKSAALWAAAIFAFYPDLIESSAMLLTETFYLFLLCLLLYLFFSFFKNQRFWLAGALGVFAGLATLARPTVLFFVPIILFYFWQKKEIKKAMVFLALLAIVFTPWTVRNYLVFQKFMPLGASGAFNFWIGNYHGGNGEQEPTKVHENYMSTHGLQELQDESIRQFKSFVITYPGEFVKLTALRISKYFSVIRPMGFWFYQQGLGQLIFILSSAAASVLLFVFGFAGLAKSLSNEMKDKNMGIYYLLAFIAATPLVNFITVVETRYRFQIYPLLAILAGFYIAYLFSQRRAWAAKAVWICAGIFILNGLVDLLLSFGRFSERLNKFL